MIVIAIISYLFFRWGVASRLPHVDPAAQQLNERVKDD